jgi:hypothetical protein
METIEQKLNYIIEEINKTPNVAPHINTSKCERIKYYKDSAWRLDAMNPETITNFNFQREVITKAENLEKVYMAEKLLHFCTGVEVHNYAPELNTAHFCGYIIKTPNINKVEELIAFLSVLPFHTLEKHYVDICKHIARKHANDFLTTGRMAEHYNVTNHAINRALRFVNLNNL